MAAVDSEQDEKLKERLRKGFEECLRPREEVTMVRQLMAQHIAQGLGVEQLGNPLSLIEPDLREVSAESRELQGLQRQYVEAVQKNLEVRGEFEQSLREHVDMMAALKQRKHAGTGTGAKVLDLHLEITRLQQKLDRLQVIQKYLDRLEQQPPAAADFWDPKVMFKDCRPLPEVPPEMVDGFTMDYDSNHADVQGLVQKLQKSVLRSKLVHRREKQRFDEAQAQKPVSPKDMTPAARLHALTAVKNALINWIESQLGKAGGEEVESEAEQIKPADGKRQVTQEAQLAEIQKHYERHVQLRQEILALLARKEKMQSGLAQVNRTDTAETAAEAPPLAPGPQPRTFLITPYIETLQALSREQKSLIREKSHINASLVKQQEEAKATLDHLAQESQLLPKYPAATSTKPEKSRRSFGEATKIGSKAGLAVQVQPWMYAADSAKIATLEVVAEKVEDGMMSVEESRKALEDVCKLLDVQLPEESSGKKREALLEKDLWLPEGDDQSTADAGKREVENKDGGLEPLGTIWAVLDGNLGSINE